MKKIIFVFGILLFFNSCENRDFVSSNENTELIDRQSFLPIQIFTYNNDVSPIINTYCISCHSPKGGASSYYPLTNYAEVKNAIDNIIVRIEKSDSDPLKMPQGSNLTADEISLIKKWKAGGLKE